MAREGDLSALNEFHRRYVARTTGGVFLSMSSDQETYVPCFGSWLPARWQT